MGINAFPVAAPENLRDLQQFDFLSTAAVVAAPLSWSQRQHSYTYSNEPQSRFVARDTDRKSNCAIFSIKMIL